MNKEIKAEVKNLRKIFTYEDYFYQIPDYQRPYSWNKEHVSELLSDLVDAFQKDRQEEYFCGSLVLVKNGDRYDVIDGQQRLTTFTILFCVLRDFYEYCIDKKYKRLINEAIVDKDTDEKKKLKLLTDETKQNEFLQTVLTKINFEDKIDKNNKYLQNALILKKDIDEQKNDLGFFVEWMFEKVVLATIECFNQDTAIQIFNVLNDRGMDLTSADIIKSSLMIHLDTEEKNVFKKDWDAIKGKLDYKEKDKDRDKEFVALFTTYLYYRTTTNPQTFLHKELLGNLEQEKKPIDSLKVIRDIKNFSESFVKVKKSENIKVYCLRYLRHEVYWTSILCTALHKNYEHYDELVKVITAYYYQNWIAGHTLSRIKQTSFNILKSVKENKTIEKIKEEIKRNLGNTTHEYKRALESPDFYSKTWAKPILFFIEYHSKDGSHQNFIRWDEKNHIEHIFPQNPDNNWDDFSQEDKDKYTDCLGNLTPLSGRKNIQASNSSFSKKKEIYKSKDGVMTSFRLTQDVFDQNDSWTPEKIEARQKKMISKINENIDIFG